MGSRFVRPEVTVLTLADGEKLTVRKRLNHGEQTACFARMYMTLASGERKVDTLKVGLAMISAYLLDWTLTDDSGNVVQIRDKSLDDVESALNALDPYSFNEIRAAIEKHEIEMAKERAAGKPTGGESKSAATSSSPAGAAGDTSGSSS